MPTNLTWDGTGERKFEAGNDQVILFVMGDNGSYETGVAWNGITGFTISNTGGEENALWADNIKYASLRSAEECGGTIQAYWCPPEFYPCDGSVSVAQGVVIGQQTRKPCAFAVRTKIGNDVNGLEHGYKWHLIYNATVNPSERAYETLNDSPDAIQLSWEFTTTPINCTGHKPVSHIEVSSVDADSTKFKTFENGLLAGTLPLPDALITAFTTP